MNLTVDASVFVATSRREETHYPASRRYLQQVRAQGSSLFCPILVLPECAGGIAGDVQDRRPCRRPACPVSAANDYARDGQRPGPRRC